MSFGESQKLWEDRGARRTSHDVQNDDDDDEYLIQEAFREAREIP